MGREVLLTRKKGGELFCTEDEIGSGKPVDEKKGKFGFVKVTTLSFGNGQKSND